MAKVKTKGWAVTFNANTAKEETVNIPVGGPVRASKKLERKCAVVVVRKARSSHSFVYRPNRYRENRFREHPRSELRKHDV